MSVEQWSNSVFHFPASPIRSSGIVGRCGRKQSAGLENGNYKTTVSYRHAAPPELGIARANRALPQLFPVAEHHAIVRV